MNKVVRLNKKNKKDHLERYTRFLSQFPTVNLGSLTVIFSCIILMILATFTQLPVGLYSDEILVNPGAYFSDFSNILLTLFTHKYSPQIPFAIFTGALLGPYLGTFTMIVYIMLGLIGFPVFAGGGGLYYILEPTFGFIFGYVVAAFLVGKNFSLPKISSFRIVLASILGVLAIHLIGDLYLFFNLKLSGISFSSMKPWFHILSFSTIFYDILFSIALCSLARPIKGLLWFIMDTN